MGFFDFLNNKNEKDEELWLDRLIDWANRNNLPDLKIEKHPAIVGGHHFGIPRNKKKLLNLHTLNLEECNLSDLPKEIGKLKNLKKIWLDGNNLKRLPDEICDLTLLEELYIPNNDIEVLPENLCELENLLEINFYKNNIKVLPFSMVLLKKLVKIDFRSQKHGKKLASPDIASSILQGNLDNDCEFRKHVGCSNDQEWGALKDNLRNKPIFDISVNIDGKNVSFMDVIVNIYGENIAANQDSWHYDIAKF